MSIAAYEQRLQALEMAVADLRSQQSARQVDRTSGPTDDLTPDADQPLVPAVPPKHLSRLRARLSCVQPGPRNLGLSPPNGLRCSLGKPVSNHDWYELTEGPSLLQGDLLRDCPVFGVSDSFSWPPGAAADIEVEAKVFDLVVMTQSCDLENEKCVFGFVRRIANTSARPLARYFLRFGLPHDARARAGGGRHVTVRGCPNCNDANAAGVSGMSTSLAVR